MFKHNLTACLNTQRPNKKGLCPIRIRATIKGKVTYYPVNLMIHPDNWENGEVIKHPNKNLYNAAIRNKITELEKIFLEQSISGEPVQKIKKQVAITFKKYAQKIIDRDSGYQAEGTIEQKNVYLAKFNEFSPYQLLKDVDKDVMYRFEDHCKRLGNDTNTVWTNTKFIKYILNSAVTDGLISKSPGKGFKGAKYSDPLRIVLNKDELKRFEDFADNEKNNRTLRSIAAWFLFSCYTGLRYGDMSKFKGFVNDKVFLETEKTGEIVSIFATKKIIEAKARLENNIYSNQKMNSYLKDLAVILNIDKRIHCHLARHTFAVEYLNRGGDIVVLSKILGHTSLKVTQIYAKISNKRADEDMRNVWDKS